MAGIYPLSTPNCTGQGAYSHTKTKPFGVKRGRAHPGTDLTTIQTPHRRSRSSWRTLSPLTAPISTTNPPNSFYFRGAGVVNETYLE